MIKRIRVLIYGHVQGVFFRDTTRERAQALRLAGYVRNLPDGSVEVEAEGEQDKLERLVNWCHQGPPAARVDRVDVTWHEPTNRWTGFTVRG